MTDTDMGVIVQEHLQKKRTYANIYWLLHRFLCSIFSLHPSHVYNFRILNNSALESQAGKAPHPARPFAAADQMPGRYCPTGALC